MGWTPVSRTKSSRCWTLYVFTVSKLVVVTYVAAERNDLMNVSHGI